MNEHVSAWIKSRLPVFPVRRICPTDIVQDAVLMIGTSSIRSVDEFFTLPTGPARRPLSESPRVIVYNGVFVGSVFIAVRCMLETIKHALRCFIHCPPAPPLRTIYCAIVHIGGFTDNAACRDFRGIEGHCMGTPSALIVNSGSTSRRYATNARISTVHTRIRTLLTGRLCVASSLWQRHAGAEWVAAQLPTPQPLGYGGSNHFSPSGRPRRGDGAAGGGADRRS